MAPSHPHKNKRLFRPQSHHRRGHDQDQQQITQFFATSSTTSSAASAFTSSTQTLSCTGTTHATASASLAPPPPPAAIQASLLSVGMRVRKSVGDGYRTGKPTSPISSPTNPSMRGMGIDSYFRQSQQQKHHKWHPSWQESWQQHNQRHISYAAPAGELLPFCGLHKTGGFAVQPQPPQRHSQQVDVVDAYAQQDTWGMEGFTSSQESVEEVDAACATGAVAGGVFGPTSGNARKRGREGGGRWHYFDAEDEDGQYDKAGVAMDTKLERIKAILRRRVPPIRGGGLNSGLEGSSAQGADVAMEFDFEEADFLRPRDVVMEM